jgi:hypothetical protein
VGSGAASLRGIDFALCLDLTLAFDPANVEAVLSALGAILGEQENAGVE